MTGKKLTPALATLASLAGGLGVALAALAAHKFQSPAMASAAQMLMIHGAAGLALLAMASRSQSGGIWLAAASCVVFGSIVFATAVAVPLLTESRVLAPLAPVGGSTVILGWAIAAIAGMRDFFAGHA